MTSRSARSKDLNARLDLEGLKTAVSRAIGICCVDLKIKAEGGLNVTLPFHTPHSDSDIGGFNRVSLALLNKTLFDGSQVYFLQCYGGAEYVVRVAFDRFEYRGMHKMESEVFLESVNLAVPLIVIEVATIAWLAQTTDVPVPTILYHSPTDQNEAHAPFMVMEKVVFSLGSYCYS